MTPTSRKATTHKPVLRWLVVVSTNLDELPIRLCKTQAAAEKVIANIGTVEIRKVADLMAVNYAELVNASVVTFADDAPISLSVYDLPDAVMNPIVGTGPSLFQEQPA